MIFKRNYHILLICHYNKFVKGTLFKLPIQKSRIHANVVSTKFELKDKSAHIILWRIRKRWIHYFSSSSFASDVDFKSLSSNTCLLDTYCIKIKSRDEIFKNKLISWQGISKNNMLCAEAQTCRISHDNQRRVKMNIIQIREKLDFTLRHFNVVNYLFMVPLF